MHLFKNLVLFIFFLFPVGLLAQTHCCCPVGNTCQPFVGGSLNCSFSCLAEGLGAPGIDATENCPGTACSTLPVSLITFEARTTSEGVELKWETETELNNRGFQIQRMSGISLNWEVISFIEGTGNSSRPEYYEYFDHSAPPGTNYYRLNQIDYDGTSSFSQIETTTSQSKNKFLLWPTITRSGVVIRNENYQERQLNVPLLVFDMMGRKVMESSFQESIVLDVSALIPGTYIVNMIVNNKIETLRFIKVE